MYNNTVLKNAIEQSSSLSIKSLVLAEWNLNFSENIKMVGNYRWRYNDPFYATISSTWSDETESTINPTYYNALVSNTTIFGGTDNNEITYFKKDNEKEKILFSLTDCLNRFRPRSGINKARIGITPWTHYANESMHKLPRYYLASKDDKFKYWTSYRKEQIPMYTFNTTGTTGWTANSNTTISSGTRPSSSEYALILTPTTSGTVGATSTIFHYTTAALQYTASAQFQSTSAGETAQIKLDWYDTNKNSLSSITSSTATSINSTGLTRVTLTATAPANAVYAKIIVEIQSTSGTTDIQYVSNVSLTLGTVSPDLVSIVRGQANSINGGTDAVSGGVRINDANPFVIYNRPVPTNRIVVKMQTHVADSISSTDIYVTNKSGNKVVHPFYESPNLTTVLNQKTPVKWYIEYLDKDNNWQIAKAFDKNSVRSTGKRIIGSDGYVELAYGISNIPVAYLNNFTIVGTFSDVAALPSFANIGEAYLIGSSSSAIGQFYVWNGISWDTPFTPTYGWVVAEETITANTVRLTNLVNPDYYAGSTIYDKTYREFKFIYGIRVRVETMSLNVTTFDLIEMSPRLAVDLSDKTLSYSIEKTASDIGNTGMPVGQLLASNGSIEIFDYDQAINPNNPNSILNILNTDGLTILNSFVTKNVQFKFYEIYKNIYDSGANAYNNYYVPIKTMYADGFPQIQNTDRTVSINLRNLFFYLESVVSPPLFFSNITLSMAASILLDSIGFSNYRFDRLVGNELDKDEVIPFFFVSPDTTVASVLNDLAQSTQTAIFFDENNQLVFMSKNRMVPSIDRTQTPAITGKATDITLYGTKDFAESGANNNYTVSGTPLSNIIDIASQSNDVFNAGKITYSNKYIQKTYGGNLIDATSTADKYKKWFYKPVLLWEVGSSQNTTPKNEESSSNNFTLSAIVLNSDLSNTIPYVDVNGVLSNYIMDFGSSITFISRYGGYFYANAEIIKYDAVEYSVPSTAKTGFAGQITTGSNKITLTSGDTSSFSIGETIVLSVGSGIEGQIRSIPSSTELILTKTEKYRPSTGLVDANATLNTASREVVSNATATGSITFGGYYTYSNIWITSEQQYASEFAKLPSGAKIYPTGRVRIYTQPYYNTDGKTFKPGAVAKHGRGQFGTTIAFHKALLNKSQADDREWQSSNTKAINMSSKYIFKSPYYGTSVTFASASTQTSPTTNLKIINTTTSTENIQVGWYVSGTNIVAGTKVETKVSDTQFTIDTAATAAINSKQLIVSSVQNTTNPVAVNTGKTGIVPTSNSIANGTAIVTPFLRDKFSTTFLTEASLNVDKTATPEGAIKSSALILKGNDGLLNASQPLDYTSYICHNLGTTAYNHYGTRMRVLGTQKVNGYQTSVGAMPILTSNSVEFTGSSGGMCFRVDQTVNVNTGYYFEIVAVNKNNIYLGQTGTAINLNNIYFYKITKSTADGTTENSQAIPILLWAGTANIIADNGDFAGIERIVQQKEIGCYDLVVESVKTSGLTETFDLYLNDILLARVTDNLAIPKNTNNNTVGMFTRGLSKVLFENIYALNVTGDNTSAIGNITPFNSVSMEQRKATGAYSKFGINSSIASTFLTGISSSSTPLYNLYLDEFGTIMRECAYFNVRYDKAYPAIFAKIIPTINTLQAYAVSGFNPNPYGAEFLIFNTLDIPITLDSTTSNYLQIQGVTFTQQSSHDFTVDEYFSKTTDFSNPALSDSGTIISPSSQLKTYSDIQSSRMTYGRKEFNISGPYIQSESAAKKIMEWMVNKNMSKKSRLSVGIEIFPNPMIQLGDIVEINYTDKDSINQISYSNARFVVYNISYTRNSNGPKMTIYLSEVI
jgi:hypothetical protein